MGLWDWVNRRFGRVGEEGAPLVVNPVPDADNTGPGGASSWWSYAQRTSSFVMSLRIPLFLSPIFLMLFKFALDFPYVLVGIDRPEFMRGQLINDFAGEVVLGMDDSLGRDVVYGLTSLGYWLSVGSVTLLAYVARPAFYVANNLPETKAQLARRFEGMHVIPRVLIDYVAWFALVLSGAGIAGGVDEAMISVGVGDLHLLRMLAMFASMSLVGTANYRRLTLFLLEIGDTVVILVRRAVGHLEADSAPYRFQAMHARITYALRSEQAGTLVKELNISADQTSLTVEQLGRLEGRLSGDLPFPVVRMMASVVLGMPAAAVLSYRANTFFAAYGLDTAEGLGECVNNIPWLSWLGFFSEIGLDIPAEWLLSTSPVWTNVALQTLLIWVLLCAPVFSARIVERPKFSRSRAMLFAPGVGLSAMNFAMIREVGGGPVEEFSNTAGTVSLCYPGAATLFGKWLRVEKDPITLLRETSQNNRADQLLTDATGSLMPASSV